MQTPIKTFMMASSLALALGAAGATLADSGTPEAELQAREFARQAEQQARTRAGEAESHREAADHYETRARERAREREQQAREVGAAARQGMQRPSMERPTMARPTMERPAMPAARPRLR